MTSTTVRRSIRPRRSGTSARAASPARSMRSTGFTSASRSMAWPEAMTTGMRSGSMARLRHGCRPGDSGSCGPGGRYGAASYHRHPVEAPWAGRPVPRKGRDGGDTGGVSTAGHAGSPGTPAAADGLVPDDFLFGVATAGFQVEGGFNGPGEPANNWLAWEQVGRVDAVRRCRRLLGPSRGVARPGRRPRVRQLPPRRRVGAGDARRARRRPGRPRPATWPSSRAAWSGG